MKYTEDNGSRISQYRNRVENMGGKLKHAPLVDVVRGTQHHFVTCLPKMHDLSPIVRKQTNAN